MKTKMRLAMAGPFGLRAKGTVRARIIPLASALKRKGVEAKVFVPPWDSPQDSGKTEVIGGVEVHHLSLPGSIPLIRHFLISLNLARSCLAFRPDLIWLFKPIGYTGLAAALLKPFKVPVIVDADDWEGKGGWAERNPYPLLWRAIMPVQERWTLTHADAVTAASRTLQSIIWSMGFPEAKVLYLPNGIEPLPFWGPGQRKAVALYTRFVEFTTDDLLKIWAKILEKEPDAELIIVGKGFKGEEENFLTKAVQAGIGGKIRAVGWREREEALALLGEARVAIWPCRDNLINRAKCPVKLAELVGIGLPVVAEAVGEASSYVLPELLVENGNYEELADRVVTILRDEEKARELGRRGRERLLSLFSWDSLADKFLQFLEETGLG